MMTIASKVFFVVLSFFAEKLMRCYLSEELHKIKNRMELGAQIERKRKKQHVTYKLHVAFSTISLLSLRCGTLFERLRCLLER